MLQICGKGGREIVLYLFLSHKLFLFIYVPFIHLPQLFCFQSVFFFLFFGLFYHIQCAACWTLPFSSPDVFSSSSHLCCFKGNQEHDTLSLCWQYLHNIKQIASGNMFQCLSTPHGVAGGLASISSSAAKTGVQNEESGCTW